MYMCCNVLHDTIVQVVGFVVEYTEWLKPVSIITEKAGGDRTN